MPARTTSLIPVGRWVIDPAHSSVGFAVKHMGIATVRAGSPSSKAHSSIGEDLASSNSTRNSQSGVDHDQ